MKYKVNVEELLSRIVEVEAENEEEAEEKVREMYMNEDIVLDASDFQSVEYFVQQKKVNRILFSSGSHECPIILYLKKKRSETSTYR